MSFEHWNDPMTHTEHLMRLAAEQAKVLDAIHNACLKGEVKLPSNLETACGKLAIDALDFGVFYGSGR